MPILLPKYRVRRVVDELPDDVSLEEVIERLVLLYEKDLRPEETPAVPRSPYILKQLLEGFEQTDEDLADIALECANLPIHDERTAEEILGYDADGLPE